jgi:DNA-binding beta-propeller fold protein YncE
MRRSPTLGLVLALVACGSSNKPASTSPAATASVPATGAGSPQSASAAMPPAMPATPATPATPPTPETPATPAAPPAPEPPAPLAPGVTAIALPGGESGVFLDYLAYDAAHHRVWVPASGTGRVDVIDAKTGALTPIEGWATKEFERRGQKRVMGPSAATVGDGVVYIGNRGDSSVCAVDAKSLEKKGCVTLDSSPDGLQYVAATKEVWVTTPRDKQIRILDVKKAGEPKEVGKIEFEGEPEGFAVDNKRKVFFTNLEDKDKTLVVDVTKRAVTKTWDPKCGEDGPKGLIFDDKANHLLVVCPSSIEVLDVAKDGAQISKLDVGDGLDAVDWVASKRLVFAAAGRAQKMVVASLPANGTLAEVTTVSTSKGARNAVASSDGTAFVADGPAGRILMVPPTKK